MSNYKAGFLGRFVYFAIKETNAARTLANHLVTSPNDRIILPFIDHPGPMSRELLNQNFKSLTVYESESERAQKFKLHVEKYYPDKNVNIHHEDLFDLIFKVHCDIAQRRCSYIVGNQMDSEPIKFLSPLIQSKYESSFIRTIYEHNCLRLGLGSRSRLSYYILMSDRLHTYMCAQPSKRLDLYKSLTVLCNTVFNIRTLDSWDLKTCFRISIRKLQNTASSKNPSYRKVHLVRLDPKLDIIHQLQPRAFIEYRFLVTQMMHKPTGLVTSFLDRFFDHYREDIFPLGINQATRSGDLNFEQYYKLFIYLSNRQDYQKSIFLQAAENNDVTMFSL